MHASPTIAQPATLSPRRGARRSVLATASAEAQAQPNSVGTRIGIWLRPKNFIFFDKATGMRRFEVPADDHGRLPTQHAAGLLAVHSVAHRRLPGDFSVLVETTEDVLGDVAQHAQELIRSCSLCEAPRVPLSRRQNEVLSAIAHNLSNKEIADALHLSERTVKFHVSALLQKFKARKRADLMLEAFDLIGGGPSAYPVASPPRLQSPGIASTINPGSTASPLFIERRASK